MTNICDIEEYLSMQRSQYNWRASQAIVGTTVERDLVVGSFQEQEKFPYDDNILKFFSKDTKESSILEYGCGPGRNLRRLAPKFEMVAGVDISELNIKNCEKFLIANDITNFKLFVNHGNNIPVDLKFDIVFEVICLQHICSYDIRLSILKDMANICKDGGIVVTQFAYNNSSPPYEGKHHVGYYDNKLVGVKDTNGWCDCCVTDEDQLKKDFELVGLKNCKIWFTDMVNDPSHDKWVWCCGEK